MQPLERQLQSLDELEALLREKRRRIEEKMKENVARQGFELPGGQQ